jgi:NAD(P)-dependent dehydrogenase (short-subunit alcohol dehydrogenase family)
MKSEKIWFVTGASKGLGLEIVKAALASGDKVVAAVRNNPEELSGAINNSENLYVVVLDVTKEDQAKTALAKAIERFGRIDVLVNNAGYSLLSAIEEATDDEVRAQFDTNVFGLLNVLRAALPYLRRQKNGHIINISALYGFAVPLVGYGLYGATKFGVEAISEALSLEVKPLGIHVTAVEPGMFTTDLLATTSMKESKNRIADYDGTVGYIRNAIPTFNGTQPGDPVKFGKAIVVLANSDNPPLHLPLGNDSLAVYQAKATSIETDFEQWKELIGSTDHD